MNQKSGLTLVLQPQAYFHELVTSALGQHPISIRPETEFYLVNLLNQFITTDRLYMRDADGNYREESLAILLKEALEQPKAEDQSLLFRHLGDVSLYVAGFFQDSLNRKLVDVDYYIDVGGTAYQQVAERSEEEVLRSLYSELSNKFPNFVEVLAQVSEKTTPRSEKDLLRLYDLWQRTKSERAAKTLQEAGIVLQDKNKKEIQ